MSENPINAGEQSPLTLAFYGDAVFSVLARRYIVEKGNRPVGGLHKASAQLVCAQTQARGVSAVADMLSEKEAAVFRRGRNAHVHSVPKNAEKSQYHAATGLETLFGWLYLRGEHARLNELFARVMESE